MFTIIVVESRARKKKTRGGMDVFQFAQTIEADAWEDEKRRRDLQVNDIHQSALFTRLNGMYQRMK
jgi:hypothetical protein